MKILFIITSLENGGAERVCATLANYFSANFEVEILYFEGEVFYEINPAVKLVKIELGNKFRILKKLLIIRKNVKNANTTISFMDSTNILTLISSFFTGRKIIISEHSAHDFVSKKWRILRRIFYPFASALSVLSKSDYDYYNFVKNRKVIYNPVNYELCADLKKENVIIFVGRLEYVKGCDIFLKALAKLDLKGFEIRVLGDGSKKTELLELAKNLGLKVEFKGNVKDIESEYKRAKIIVSSSRFEGLGNALIESAFFNCVRVATPTTGAKELINDGINGFLSKDFSEDEVATTIKRAMNASNEIIVNSRMQTSEFKIEKIAKKWMELI